MLFDASSIQWLLKHLEPSRPTTESVPQRGSVVGRAQNCYYENISVPRRYRVVVLTAPLRQLLQLNSQSRAYDV